VLVPGAVELVALGLGSYWGARSIIQNSPVESRARMREGFIEVNALPKVRSECNWMDGVVIRIEISQVSAMRYNSCHGEQVRRPGIGTRTRRTIYVFLFDQTV
jgi:hypothetical protein